MPRVVSKYGPLTGDPATVVGLSAMMRSGSVADHDGRHDG